MKNSISIAIAAFSAFIAQGSAFAGQLKCTATQSVLPSGSKSSTVGIEAYASYNMNFSDPNSAAGAVQFNRMPIQLLKSSSGYSRIQLTVYKYWSMTQFGLLDTSAANPVVASAELPFDQFSDLSKAIRDGNLRLAVQVPSGSLKGVTFFDRYEVNCK